MERTLAEIEADIASLRARASKFRELALQHRDADNLPISRKLLEVVAELESSAAEMRKLVQKRTA
jgi:hypothetical protein